MINQTDLPAEAVVAGLEREWAAAFQRHDIAGLQRLMADGYALIIAVESMPLQIVPRNAWLESLEAYEIEEVGIDQVHVRVYGDVAVVALLWRQRARLRGQDRSAQFALVDVWVRQGDNWRIAERHSGRPEHPGSARPPAIPAE
jgi:ketosteroid isomerase-like protein